MFAAFAVAFITGLISMAPAPAAAQVAVGVVVNLEPPELPVYDQPLCPGEDYIWTPGYWAWDGSEYYWVPGTWVLAPQPGFFWTPGYWAWRDTGYFFTAGFWGPVIGFYGGINYGFGYFGTGFVGGRWDRGHFFYNTAINNVNLTIIHNTYVDRTVIVNNATVTRISYNGGRGGINARPTPAEEAALRERHVGPVEAQVRHEEAARSNPQFRASYNHGKPPIAATARPGDFKTGAVAAREGGTVHTEETRTENAPPHNAVHPRDLPPAGHMTPPNTGIPKQDQKYQKQQDKLEAQQAKERDNLQAKQEQEHTRKANASDAEKQQMEQRHQQQTQQLQQKHDQQRQTLQQRQQPKPGHPQR